VLTHPILDQLTELRLTGMHRAFAEQIKRNDLAELSFEERFGLLLDHEMTGRDDRRMQYRLRTARLKQPACIEDIDYRHRRSLDKRLMQKLAAGRYLDEHLNILITGPTGVGKTWLACALGHKACRDNRSVVYRRLPRLFDALALARGDGQHARMLKSLARVELLILDDWGLAPMLAEQRRDLLEIMEDRHGRGSTIVTSQLPVEHWHEIIADPTIADAVLDRLVHNAHRLILKGESLRKAAAKRQELDDEPANCTDGHADTRHRPTRWPASSECPAGFNRYRRPASPGISGRRRRNA
jgi:DNA replication protein DnaC